MKWRGKRRSQRLLKRACKPERAVDKLRLIVLHLQHVGKFFSSAFIIVDISINEVKKRLAILYKFNKNS